MQAMSADEISEVLRPFVIDAGIEPLAIEVTPTDEPPFDTLPNASIRVSLSGVGPDETARRTSLFEKAFNKAFGCEIRTGYYSAEIGYDEIPEGEAVIEVDLLPFELTRSANPPLR